jgi:hypothetical protein
MTDDREIRKGRLGAGSGGVKVGVVIGFNTVVAVVVVLLDDDELNASIPAIGPVQAIVGGTSDHEIPGIDRAAEEFDAVVFRHVRLDIFDGRAPADALKGNAVEFVVGAEEASGELDPHVAQDAAVVGRVGAAIGPCAPPSAWQSPGVPQLLTGARPLMISPPQSPRAREPGFLAEVKPIGASAVPSAMSLLPRRMVRKLVILESP